MPAKAGIRALSWVPAFAGKTIGVVVLRGVARDAGIAIAVQVTKQPRDTIDYAFTSADVGRSPDLVPNVEAVQEGIDTALDLKLLPAAVKVAPDHTDLSMVEEAKRRLDGK
jgi:hypothetical protein